MFLSDHNIAEFKRRKYEKYMRENNPTVYNKLKSLRKELSANINQQRVNPFSKKPIIATVSPRSKKNTYRMLKEMGGGKESMSNLRSNMQWLSDKQRDPLPDLSQMRRKVDVLPPKNDLPNLLPPKNDPLPAFETLRKPLSIETKRGSGVANPVKNTFSTTSGRKPQSIVLTPKPKTPTAKDANKLLRTLGVAGVVSGGVLGAYGLKKYYDSRKKER